MSQQIIDLRSDTITLPKREMLEAILEAPLGDDILGEDPTVNELERRTAEMFGMEAALLLTSGTMANQVAIMNYCNRGEEVIMSKYSHIFTLEGGATSAVAQVQIKPMNVTNGVYDIDEMASYINEGDIQRPKTGLICLENTHNLNRGEIIPLENMKAIKELADKHNIPVFLDGARVFNAAVELGVSVKEICQHVDAVQFCLTKGLGCPIGSMLVGSKEFIEKAVINRQRLGGGMRQAGIIAAPALYALDHMVDRLKEDNDRAKKLAKKLSSVDGISIDPAHVHTNVLAPKVVKEGWNAARFIEFLADEGIKVKHIGENEVRMIIHFQVTDEHIDKVIKAYEKFADLR
ncbi:MAG TPA: GntG family PLP-dependent aldolase [Bacillota bacterium]|nr:GntG family PLP-dependent aldolase [Bacillota bacterium]